MKKIISLILAAVMIISVGAMSVSAATAKSITLNKTTLTMTVGDMETLTAKVVGYKKYTLVYSTDNSKVVSIKNRKLTAKAAGTANVTVKIKGTSYKAVCKVTVKSAPATTNATKRSGNTIDFVRNIKIGWNLGNTMDALGNGLSSETSWGNVKTTKAMIDKVKSAGFNAVRIPTSWGNHMDGSNKVDDAWMKRVKEIVDYAIDNDMYVILNAHHENGWLSLSSEKEAATKAKFSALWKQIAEEFKNYDEHLIFEGTNEPRTEGTKNEWNGGTKDERAVLNNLLQTFVDTVRAAGGKNSTRYLMITPYAASSSYSALNDLAVPDDDRIIISVHSYSPYNMALNRNSNEKALSASGKSEIDGLMKTLNDRYISKGQAVIIGEFGSLNKENTAQRTELATYYVAAAKKIGVPCFWWDNGTKCPPSQGEGFGLLDRTKLEWWYPEIVKALVDGTK